MRSPTLLTTLLLMVMMPSLGLTSKDKPSGGVEGPAAQCKSFYSAKEHALWLERYKAGRKISQKMRKRQQLFLYCARSKNDAKKMTIQWKRFKKPPLPKRHALWVRIGRCEQPGGGYKGINWSHPGPTYQGGLGFWYGTWDSFKYRGMPDNAGQASWMAQMKVANRLYRLYGTSPWGCA